MYIYWLSERVWSPVSHPKGRTQIRDVQDKVIAQIILT